MTAASHAYRTFRAPERAGRWTAAVVGVALVGAVGAAIARPAFIAPADGRDAVAGSVAAPGEFRLGPGNMTPPGVVNPVAAIAQGAGSVAAPGEFRLGPGNMTPPGVVEPAR